MSDERPSEAVGPTALQVASGIVRLIMQKNLSVKTQTEIVRRIEEFGKAEHRCSLLALREAVLTKMTELPHDVVCAIRLGQNDCDCWKIQLWRLIAEKP